MVKRWLTAREAAEKLGVHWSWVRHLCQNDRIKGATKLGKSWMIPDPPVVLNRFKGNLVTTPEAGRQLGITRQRVVELCRLGLIVGANRDSGTWAIPTPVKRLPAKRSKKEPIAA